MKYIIGSGWWCDDNKRKDKGRVFYGDNEIRGQEFHKLWYQSIINHTNPDKIVIVDSNSPIKPKLANDSRLEFVSLNENPGHAMNHSGKYGGWLRSVILSLQYAVLCDADYYIYVEQDVLLKGNGLIEFCIKNMKTPFMFGKSVVHKHPLQQSFFIIRRDGMELFLRRISKIQFKDKSIIPERKFAIASSFLLSSLPQFIFYSNFENKYISKMTFRLQTLLIKMFKGFDYVPFGYGRDRPIMFTDKHLYFQHGSQEEISNYFESLEQGGL